MNISTNIPEVTFQYKKTIIVVIISLTIIGGWLLMLLGWKLQSSIEPFSKHIPLFEVIATEFVKGDNTTWSIYKSKLISEGSLIFFYMLLTAPFVVSFALACLISYKFLYVQGGRSYDSFIKGTKRIKAKHVQPHARVQLRRLLKSNRKSRPKAGLYLHPDVQIPVQAEVGNLLITGKPGSGKTVIIKYLLSQLIKRKTKLFIFDEKKDYTKFIYEPHKCHLIAPWDKRGTAWDIAKDLHTPNGPSQFADAVIPETTEKIWGESARLVLEGLILHLQLQRQNWGWKDLNDLLGIDDDQLKQYLNISLPKAAKLIEVGSKTTQGITNTLVSSLKWMEVLSHAWPKSYENGLSIKEWIQNQGGKKTIILQGDPLFSTTGGPLCSVFLTLMTEEFLAAKKPTKTHLILDELDSLPKTPSLNRWISVSRQQGGRTIIGMQAVSQLQSKYGKDNTDSLTSFFSKIIALKVGSTGDTKNYIANSLGKYIAARPRMDPDSKGQISEWQELTINTVHPFELTELPDADSSGVCGFLTINGWNATYELKWPILELQQIADAEIPAKWTQGNLIDDINGSNQRTRIEKRRQEGK